MLTRYWRLPHTKTACVLFALFAALTPYVLSFMYFAFLVIPVLGWNMFVIGSLLISEKEERFSLRRTVSAAVLTTLALGGYPPVINLIAVAFSVRLLFAALRQTGRLAICSVPIPPWVVIAGSAFSNRRCGYPAFLVHFGLVRFFMAIPTENEGTGERGERRERRTESAARQSAFLRDRIGFAVFSAGSTLGLRAPDCAKESKVEAALPPLWTLTPRSPFAALWL